MLSSNQAQINESLYLKESENLLQKIGEATTEAIDSVNKFDVQTNSDKICILTVANNFSKDLEHTLNSLQRITIDNHKKGDDNRNLKEAVKAFSTFVYSIQLAFGNDLNKLKLELINVLQNLSNKLNPLLDIVRQNSPYSSKWEITNILNYLYIAIEKVKMRTQWERLNHQELLTALANILEAKLATIEKMKDKQHLVTRYYRISHEFAEGVLHVLEEMDIDVDHFDDKIRNSILSATTKIADAIFDLDKAVRGNYPISELTLYSTLATINVVPSIKDVLDILFNESLQDSNFNTKNSLLNFVVNALGNTIRFTRDCERILEN